MNVRIAAAPAPAAVVPARSAEKKSPYIVSAAYDRAFFIFSPLWALALGAALSFTPLATRQLVLYGKTDTWVTFFSGVFTMAHLVIVFFRSHGNPDIFRLHKTRFVAAPIALFGAMLVSSWAMVTCLVLATWWDVYHSGLQTFGFGRIYDQKAGALSDETRSLDRGLNLVLYAGPIFGGATLMEHLSYMENFSSVGEAFFSSAPERVAPHLGQLAVAMVTLGSAYLIYYLWRYSALVRKGLPVSREKVWLYAVTGACSIYVWGFNAFGQAFFIMNFFHSLQYFALVWHSEKKRMTSLFLLVGAGLAYGLWAEGWGYSSHTALSLLLTVSIMHFWYDSFIWSVTKRQVV